MSEGTAMSWQVRDPRDGDKILALVTNEWDARSIVCFLSEKHQRPFESYVIREMGYVNLLSALTEAVKDGEARIKFILTMHNLWSEDGVYVFPDGERYTKVG